MKSCRAYVSKRRTMQKFLTSMLIGTIVVVATVVIASLPSATVRADNLPGEIEYIDAQLDVFVPHLAEYQDAYQVTNGSYMQALTSHSTPPEGVADPDGIYTHPTDQEAALYELWDSAALPSSINWSMRVDVYTGPNGSGYVLVVETNIKTHTWHREINYGPEPYRNVAWYKINPNE